MTGFATKRLGSATKSVFYKKIIMKLCNFATQPAPNSQVLPQIKKTALLQDYVVVSRVGLD